jgi:hypothetical protein
MMMKKLNIIFEEIEIKSEVGEFTQDEVVVERSSSNSRTKFNECQI